MAQKAVETLLGRLLTDEDFRRRFFDEPLAVCRQEALEVTSRELEAILAVDEVQFAQFAKQLDARIVRATLRRDVGSAVTRASASRKRLAR
jgi:predicted DNA-binding protein (UPF0251 family)